jgi:hypothetical protein
MHGKLANTATLDHVESPPAPPEFVLPVGSYVPPYLCFALSAYASSTVAEACGFSAETSSMDLFRSIVARDRDFLQWDYTSDGVIHRMPDGPCQFPDPRMLGDGGKAILRKACTVLGSRTVKTLLHGDGHPGNPSCPRANVGVDALCAGPVL